MLRQHKNNENSTMIHSLMLPPPPKSNEHRQSFSLQCNVETMKQERSVDLHIPRLSHTSGTPIHCRALPSCPPRPGIPSSLKRSLITPHASRYRHKQLSRWFYNFPGPKTTIVHAPDLVRDGQSGLTACRRCIEDAQHFPPRWCIISL